MRLPSLSIIIAIQAIIWCVAGSIPSVHGPRILLYPLAWGLIAAGFLLHAKTFPISKQPGSQVGFENQQSAETPQQELAAG